MNRIRRGGVYPLPSLLGSALGGGKPRPYSWRRFRRTFTLIELLLVMVILAVLAAMVVPRFAGRGKEAKEKAAFTQIKSNFGVALRMYNNDNDNYPTTAEGLNALNAAPSTAKNWKGPYLEGDIPTDPWGNEYIYRAPGQNNPDGYDLYSMGADGKEGTEDDISNWSSSAGS